MPDPAACVCKQYTERSVGIRKEKGGGRKKEEKDRGREGQTGKGRKEGKGKTLCSNKPGTHHYTSCVYISFPLPG